VREFSKVNPQLWGKKQFKSLSTEGKLAMLYFLTCRHQTSAGCYQLPDGYAAADLGWVMETYVAARKEVEAAELILFDEEVSEIFIVGWFANNPVTNEKHKMGCSRLIESMESEKIHDAAQAEMEEYESGRLR
jgi:hypothetical protein